MVLFMPIQLGPLPERATRLLIDVLEALESELIQIAVRIIDTSPDPNQITLRVDDLSAAIRAVEVKGAVEIEESREVNKSSGAAGSIGAKLGGAPEATLGLSLHDESSGRNTFKSKANVAPRTSVDFGTLQAALAGLLIVLNSPQVWILIDEWSEIQSDLQPYLADLFRRTLLPQKGIIVKIAAIEHRSHFKIAGIRGDYTWLEIGADVTADINLDDFVVYDVDQAKATEFFKILIYKHYSVSDGADPSIKNGDELISAAFTQVNVFQEFVRAVEGVPRDALNLAALVARNSFGRKIGMEDVRKAAREWYQQDKMSVTKGNPLLSGVLNYIISEVIENRRTRAFLFPANMNYPEIDQLYDARLLHVLKKGIASKDEPGRRYDVFKIDYGCYVDLITTTRAPLGLLLGMRMTSFWMFPRTTIGRYAEPVLRPDELDMALGR